MNNRCGCEMPEGPPFQAENPYEAEINPPGPGEAELEVSWWCNRCYRDCADDI